MKQTLLIMMAFGTILPLMAQQNEGKSTSKEWRSEHARKNTFNYTQKEVIQVVDQKKIETKQVETVSDEEKERRIQENPVQYDDQLKRARENYQPGKQIESTSVERTPVDLPGFPVYVNTGNQQEDERKYQEEKSAWIQQNPTLYSNANKQVKEETKVIMDLPGYPVYVNTGNKELDDARYNQAKLIWIQNNQELYKQQMTPSTETRP